MISTSKVNFWVDDDQIPVVIVYWVSLLCPAFTMSTSIPHARSSFSSNLARLSHIYPPCILRECVCVCVRALLTSIVYCLEFDVNNCI